MFCPKLRAMNSVSEKGRVKIHQMYVRMFVRTTADNIIVSIQNFHSIIPSRQTSALNISCAICRIIDVGEENLAAARKAHLNLADHQIQTLLKIINPRPCLFPICPIHGLVTWWSSSIIVNQVVPAGCYDDNSQNIRVDRCQMWQFSVHMLQRSASRNGEICELKFWHHCTETNSVHANKFVGWIFDETVKIAISLSRAESGSHAVPNANQENRPVRPRSGKQVERNSGACRAMTDRVDKTNKQVKKCGPHQNNARQPEGQSDVLIWRTLFFD